MQTKRFAKDFLAGTFASLNQLHRLATMALGRSRIPGSHCKASEFPIGLHSMRPVKFGGRLRSSMQMSENYNCN